MEGKRIRKFFYSNEAGSGEVFNPNWLQRIIATCTKIGISKKELMEDYYPNEIALVMQEYAELNKVESTDEEEVSADEF